MKADTFVQKLWQLAPDANKLMLDGLDQDDADELREAFRCEPKANPHRCPERPLLDLVLSFDASEVEIGMVCFSDKAETQGDAIVVGEVESDPLLVDRATGEIRVEEFGSDGHLLWRCARSEHEFLDALIVVADWSARAMEALEGVPVKSTDRDSAITNAAKLAGGGEYRDFYLMLLGYDGEDE